MAEDNTVHYLKDSVLAFSIGGVGIKVIAFDKNTYTGNSYDRINASGCYELHYVTGGRGTLVTDDRYCELKRGVFYAAGGGKIYRQINGGRQLTDYTLVLRVQTATELKPEFFICEDFERAEICFKNAERECLEKWHSYGEAMENSFRELIILLYRMNNARDAGRGGLRIAANEDKYCLLTDAEFITNFKELSLERLSDVLGLSVRQCQRFLMENYKMSFTEKLLQARMLKAADYLAFTAVDIQHISEEVGYGGSSYFTRNFRRYFGMTPREYRKKCRDIYNSDKI